MVYPTVTAYHRLCMEAQLARYPFLDDAREATRREAPPIDELLERGSRSAALDRAVDRIENALTGETVGDTHRDPEVEVLSYPLARIIVSLLDDRRVTRRFATAEARTAAMRFRNDLEADRPRPEAIDRERLLDEFDLEVNDRDGTLGVDVRRYLMLVGELEGRQWRLVNRPLEAGYVVLTPDELFVLLEEAVRDRVERDLPLDVPPEIESSLDDVVDAIHDRLGRSELPETFDRIDPNRFPPCMRALLERVNDGERLPSHSRFALASFLTSIGLAPADLDAVIENEIPPELVTMAEAVIGEEGPTQFPPGSCETMVVFGDCIDPDELCERISNPLEYYHRRLEEAT